MGKLDTGQGNGRAPERLEASYHRGTSAFNRSMILLNEIVEVLVTSHLDILTFRILPPQKPKSHVARHVAIERYLARPSRQTCRQSFTKVMQRNRKQRCIVSQRAPSTIHRRDS